MGEIACETCGNLVQNTVFNFTTQQVDDPDQQINLPNSEVDVSAINSNAEENISEGNKDTANNDIDENKQCIESETVKIHSVINNGDTETSKKVDSNQNFVTNKKNRKKRRSKQKKKVIETFNNNEQEASEPIECAENDNDVPKNAKEVKPYKTWQKKMKERRKKSQNNIASSKTNNSIITVILDNIIHFDQIIKRSFKVLFALFLIIFWSLILL